jgi:hypothetical protein
MMNEEQFRELIKEIQALGYNEETAGDFAVYIGDTPEIDEHGLTVVRDESGNIVARLKLED